MRVIRLAPMKNPRYPPILAVKKTLHLYECKNCFDVLSDIDIFQTNCQEKMTMFFVKFVSLFSKPKAETYVTLAIIVYTKQK